MIPVRAFGPRAQAYAARLKKDRPTLVVEPSDAAAAQPAAVEVKLRHGGFDLVLLYDEPRVSVSLFLAAQIEKAYRTYDERRLALDTLARNELIADGRPQRDFADVDAATLKLMRDIAALADRWIVRSWMEYYRIATVLGYEPADVERSPVPYTLPAFERVPPDGSIVVWAPGQSTEDLFIIRTALEEVRREVSIVTEPGAGLGALAKASLLIAAATDDPSPALALIERGVPVIAATTSGIAEYAAGVECYEPWSRRSIFDAVTRALSAASAVCYEFKKEATPITRARVSSSRPLVSLIVRTCNRPGLLRRALQSVATQTHSPLEAIVVNNGGEDVREICESFERVRYSSMAAGNINHASNVALAQANGTYCGFLDDDDALFCDHIERLVDALERSGAPAGYADALNLYLRPIGKNFAVTGYAAVAVPAVVPSLMLSRCLLVGSPRVLFRTAILRESGGFLETLPVAGDYEAWLRIVMKGDFVRVNAVSALYSQFSNKTNVSLRDGALYHEAHKQIFERYPVGRPGIEAERVHVLESIHRLRGLGMSGPSHLLDPQPLLLPQ